MVEIEWKEENLYGDLDLFFSAHPNKWDRDIFITAVNVKEGSYFWYVPENISGQDGYASIYIISKMQNGINDKVRVRTIAKKMSEKTKKDPYIKITKPRYLERISMNDGIEIAWEGNDIEGDVDIHVSRTGSDWIYVSNAAFSEKSFIWYPSSFKTTPNFIHIMVSASNDKRISSQIKVSTAKNRRLPDNMDMANAGKTFIVTKSNDNIREGPSSGHGIVAKTKNGQTFKVKGMLGKWIVIWYDGQVAYTHVSNGYFQESNRQKNQIATKTTTDPDLWTLNLSMCSIGYAIGYGDSNFKHGYMIYGPSIRMQSIRIGYGAWDKDRSYGFNYGLYFPFIVKPDGTTSDGYYIDRYASKDVKFIDMGIRSEWSGGEFKIGYRRYHDGKYSNKISSSLSGLHLSLSWAFSDHSSF